MRGGEGKLGVYRLVQNYVVSGKTGKQLIEESGTSATDPNRYYHLPSYDKL